MQCAARVTPDGGLSVKLDLLACELAAFGHVLEDVLRQVNAGVRLQQAIERARISEAIEADQRREDFARVARLALSVYRRTGRYKLAARASGIQATDVRFFVSESNKRQKACHIQARHRLVGRLHAAGVPVHEIARRTGYHVKSVPRIAGEVRQAQLPGVAPTPATRNQ